MSDGTDDDEALAGAAVAAVAAVDAWTGQSPCKQKSQDTWKRRPDYSADSAAAVAGRSSVDKPLPRGWLANPDAAPPCPRSCSAVSSDTDAVAAAVAAAAAAAVVVVVAVAAAASFG